MSTRPTSLYWIRSMPEQLVSARGTSSKQALLVALWLAGRQLFRDDRAISEWACNLLNEARKATKARPVRLSTVQRWVDEREARRQQMLAAPKVPEEVGQCLPGWFDGRNHGLEGAGRQAMSFIAFAAALRDQGVKAHVTTHRGVWRVRARVGGMVVVEAESSEVEQAAKEMLNQLSGSARS